MYIDLVAIKTHTDTAEYKGKPEESTEFYLLSAKKIIKLLSPRYGGTSLTSEMLRCQDTISNLATRLMWADWKWDGDNDTPCKKESYRIQCGDWAIKEYLRRKTTAFQKRRELPSYKRHKRSMVKRSYDVEKISDETTTMLETAPLTNDERIVVDSYYLNDMGIHAIAATHKISVKKIRTHLANAIIKLKGVAGAD